MALSQLVGCGSDDGVGVGVGLGVGVGSGVAVGVGVGLGAERWAAATSGVTATTTTVTAARNKQRTTASNCVVSSASRLPANRCKYYTIINLQIQSKRFAKLVYKKFLIFK
jgi:hypothetical protein